MAHTLPCRDCGPDHLQRTAEYFGVLASPIRLQILRLLASGAMGLEEMRSDLSIGAALLSKHVTVLYRAGWVGKQWTAGKLRYHLAKPEDALRALHFAIGWKSTSSHAE